MKRLLIIPQYPTPLRYPNWWFQEFERNFLKYFDKVYIFGKHHNLVNSEVNHNSIANINNSIFFETDIINEYMRFNINEETDSLLLNDISFPGLFPHILFHKRPKKCFAICHATSINNHDYYEKDREQKWPIENNLSKMFSKIFVATNYHKNKLGWSNLEVVGMPCHSLLTNCIAKGYLFSNRYYDIVSVSRDGRQKINTSIEMLVKSKFGEIKRDSFNNWKEYYDFLKFSKILLITAREETFGYQILDAIYNGCIPLAPNKLSYPELLPKAYLYDSPNDLLGKIKSFVSNFSESQPCYLLNKHLIDNFYENVSLTIGEYY